ncbi:hypothetical protein CYMTET_56265 [Cymbomonas tetramitiformis]|uniref:Mutator-like transposase domain-containing protein n=1 Tax=Cymbomonas tetramitiformis TaxID=36881 RepID=A0AAE0EM48_9CHLO|nr:hypothetical protein CYMTET_56265 [Cymbomonas tetramitiformis]
MVFRKKGAEKRAVTISRHVHGHETSAPNAVATGSNESARDMPTPRQLLDAFATATPSREGPENPDPPTISPALKARQQGERSRTTTPQEEAEDDRDHPTVDHPTVDSYFDILSTLKGRRVVLDLGNLVEFLKIDVVCTKCKKGHMLPAVTEEYEPHVTNFGLASVIHLRCTHCPLGERSTTLETSAKVGVGYEVNTLHVLGEQNAGLGPAKVEKLFTSLGIDYTLHKTAHGNIQKRVGSEVREVEMMAKESCEKAFENEVISTMKC